MNKSISDHDALVEPNSAEEITPLESSNGQVPNAGEQSCPGASRSMLPWLGFNLVLFVLYVGFFHLCLVTEFPISLVIGLVIAAAMSYLCVRFYHLFANRYEFLFYLALPLDVVLEGLIPFHSGYSFYWCAAAFWSVFGAYRISRLVTKR